MKKNFTPLLYTSVGTLSLAYANLAGAQNSEDYIGNVSGEINLGEKEVDSVAVEIINIALGFVGLVAVAVLIYGGFLMITSAGNEEQTEKGKKLVISAVIGLVMIFISWGLTIWVINNLINATN